MEPLTGTDRRHVDAAEGWLGLGDLQEARAELAALSPDLADHPEVLEVRWHLHAAAKEWEPAAAVATKICEALPENVFGYVHHAYALHELKRTQEARSVLLPARAKFPRDYIVPYNLACYACQLGDLDQAWTWLSQARSLAGTVLIYKMALADSDLEPLWGRIRDETA
jgi:predicted Zn-dependent protease